MKRLCRKVKVRVGKRPGSGDHPGRAPRHRRTVRSRGSDKLKAKQNRRSNPDQGRASDPVQPDAVVDPMQGPEFWRFGSTKRLREKYPQDGYQTMQETKQQNINVVDVVVEEMEKCATTVRMLNDGLEMITCEEKVDLSYLTNTQADLLDDAITITKFGGVRAQLDDRVASCMMQALTPVGSAAHSLQTPRKRWGRFSIQGVASDWRGVLMKIIGCIIGAMRLGRGSLWCRGRIFPTLAKGQGKSSHIRAPGSRIR